MKKIRVVIYLVLTFFVSTSWALVTRPSSVTLDFTLNYQIDATQPNSLHVMKNAVHLVGNKWMLAGKYQPQNSGQTIFFMVRKLTQKNNKVNLQFMIVDADEKQVFIIEPRMNVMVGLPARLNQKNGNKVMNLDVLLKVDNLV